MAHDVPPYVAEAAKEVREEARKKKPKAAKKKSSIEATESNIFAALRSEIDLFEGHLFKLDTFSGQIMVMWPIPAPGVEPMHNWEPCALTDTHVTHLMLWLQANGFIKVSASRVNRAIEVEADRNWFSAAREVLDALPDWDEIPRLDRFWIDVCGVDVKSMEKDQQLLFQRLRYLSATARCFFIGIVARIWEPGCQNDNMPILEGPQGILKSSLLKTISLNPKWFIDSMPHDLGTKDAKQHLAGNLIVELAELQQMKSTGIEEMKKFLSIRVDKYRPPYGHHPIQQPRQCVFVGTTNANGYLRDETGNRRYWPIPCGEINIGLAGQIMPQLYAEAVVAYHRGEQWWLPPDVEMLAEIEQDQRITDDPWEDGVKTVVEAERLSARRNGETFFWVRSVTALDAVEAEKARQDPGKLYRVALILRKLGGKNMRLPRDGNERKRGFRFITGQNGAGEASHQSHQSHLKPLN